jgi:hypothetical protein
MTELALILLEFCIIFGLYILLFGFSAVSGEPIIIIVTIMIFLILMSPFIQIINEIEEIIFFNGLNEILIFNNMVPISKFILILIGIFLILELVYTSFYN